MNAYLSKNQVPLLVSFSCPLAGVIILIITQNKNVTKTVLPFKMAAIQPNRYYRKCGIQTSGGRHGCQIALKTYPIDIKRNKSENYYTQFVVTYRRSKM